MAQKNEIELTPEKPADKQGIDDAPALGQTTVRKQNVSKRPVNAYFANDESDRLVLIIRGKRLLQAG